MKQIEDLKKELFAAVENICKDYEERKEPEFKVGQWVISDNAQPQSPAIVIKINTKHGLLTFDNFMGDIRELAYRRWMRPATPSEIEAHLRKICDEKYVGKKVISLNSKAERKVQSFERYDISSDTLYYNDFNYNWVASIYCNGKFAEILSEKKKMTMTKEGFKQLYYEWLILRTAIPFDAYIDKYED
jgi:hypothetical protein